MDWQKDKNIIKAVERLLQLSKVAMKTPEYVITQPVFSCSKSTLDNVLRVNIKDTRTTPLTPFLFSLLLTLNRFHILF